MGLVTVRFDDLTPGRESSFRLAGRRATLAAHSPGEVCDVIDAAERAAADGAWVGGFVAYEAAPAFDPALTVAPGDATVAGRTPLAWFAVFDRRVPAAPPPFAEPGPLHWEASLDAAGHRAAVTAVRGHIAVGDTYQVNISMRMRAAFDGDPEALYARLVRAQRAAHCAYVDTGDQVVACASPELFWSLGDGVVTARPMKGTAPRGRWSEEDEELARRMGASAKERAENLMIVDMLRNDLGRVAEFGTVRAGDLFTVEQYDTVWQMTSTVSGRLRAGSGARDVFAALFPCGSVTGAPKARTMEIIAALEDSRRGAYCGAIGWIAPGARRASFAVGIRTAVVDRAMRSAEYGTGGAITWDSRADDEHREALAKAAVLTTSRPPFRLLETLRAEGAQYWEIERHLGRLEASARYFRFPFQRGSALRALAAVADGSLQRVRLTLDAAGRIDVSAEPLGDDGPVTLAIDTVPVDSSDPMLFHKTDARRIYDSALARHPEADDVVLVNERGEVTETTVGNLLARIGGAWCTPPLDSGLLPGVHRARLVARGDVREAVLTPADLRAATELAVVNSVRLWRPARLLHGRHG